MKKTSRSILSRLLSVILAFAFALTVMPASALQANADTVVPALNLGTSVLKDGCNSDSAATVYFGSRAYRVIGYDRSGVAANSGSIALLAAGNFDQSHFGESGNNIYETSTLKKKVDGIAAALSDAEKAAITKRTLVHGRYRGLDTDCIAGDADISNALMWPLSTKEAIQVNEKLRKVDSENPGWNTSFWWLRSPGPGSNSAACVFLDGSVDDIGNYGIYENFGVRPAFWLNLSSVLFTSAVVGGKSSGAEGTDALQKVTAYSGNEWKLTLKDDAHSSFKVDSVTGDSSEVTVTYSGATVGTENTDEFISAIIEDSSGNITYYGNIAAVTDANGEVTINLSGKYNDGDLLYIFNEQVNGDKKTDYSSALQEVNVPAAVKTKLTITAIDQEYEYNGEIQGEGDTAYEDPAVISEKITVEGLLPGDAITSIILDGQGKDVGEYELVPSNAIIGKSTDKYDIQYVNGKLRITAKEYSVTVSDDGNGTGSANPTSGTEGTEVRLSATPATGFKFKAWEVISGGVSVADSSSETTTLTIGTENVKVKATFEELPPEEYSVIVSDDGNGTGSANPTSGTEGTEVRLSATPAIGFKFKAWEVISGGVSVADSSSETTTLTIGTENVKVKATFEELPPEEYSVTVSDDGNGTGSANPTSGTEGTEVTLSATPNSGYQFKEWKVVSGDVTITDNKFEIGTSDVEVKAVFEKEEEKKPEPKPVPEQEYHHEHHYEWQIAREATPTEDGEMIYVCRECGAVLQRIPISGYIAFNEEAAKKIRNARPGTELVISTQKWISFHRMVWDELANHSDIKLVIDYMDKGQMYEVAVPAGTDVTTLMNEDGYAGFLFLSGKFGRHQIRVY